MGQIIFSICGSWSFRGRADMSVAREQAAGRGRLAFRREAPSASRQLWCLVHALGEARRYRLLIGTLVCVLTAVVSAVAYGQIELNAWNGSFYDAIARRDFQALRRSIYTFFGIAGALLLLIVAQTWVQEMIKVRLREWLTHDLLDSWLVPRRPHLLARASEADVHPDQYVQADARQFTELSTTLGCGLLQSILLLATFTGLLWSLSDQVVFNLFDGRPFSIPGYMVWCALIYAAAGSWLAWLVGRPLIRLNAERQNREAELRSTLARIHGSADAIALHGMECGERGAAGGVFASVTELSRQLANGVARLTWVTSGYGWLGLIVPVIAAMPAYAAGSLSLGGLMMVIGAFNQVQNALRWFVDNVDKIADWRARLQRVSSFRESLLALSPDPQDETLTSIERWHGRVSATRSAAARQAA
ncbi:ABC transporter ATP-binding protein/permease [Mycobacterium sp. KBS0706]|nr:ABC transporter ATP-binding protein/permease [Mycobacterium sp. KBS0706]